MNFENPDHPRLSATHLLRGLWLLAAPGLRHFVWIPLLVNLVLYVAALFVGIHYFSAFVNWLLPGWLGFMSWLLWPVFALTFVLIMYFTFTVVANIIGSPFYGRLAEKTLARVGGPAAPLPEQSVAKAMAGSLATEFKRLGYFLTRAIPLLVLFAIPGLNLIAPFLWLAFNAWFLAMEYLAYPMELQGVEFDEQRRLAQRMRTGVFSFGGAAMLGLALPGLNVLIPPAAVVGATLYLSEVRPRIESPAGSAQR
jgi:CysZ protein